MSPFPTETATPTPYSVTTHLVFVIFEPSSIWSFPLPMTSLRAALRAHGQSGPGPGPGRPGSGDRRRAVCFGP
eukprot:753064-Hanusia_phi.AAC.1